MPYAHSLNGRPESEWEPLAEHLNDVGDLAADFATVFLKPPHPARAAGLLHDMGKAVAAFLAYLRGQGSSPDHSTAGAIEAKARYGEPWGQILAFVIAGHHAGLANGVGTGGRLTSLDDRLKKDLAVPVPDGIDLPDPATLPPIPETRSAFSWAMLVRMLFSCLVDADRLATEAFMAKAQGEPPVNRGNHLPLATLRDRLTAHLDDKAASLDRPLSRVNALRARVLDTAVERAAWCPGLFSLTVPTGGGKTLTSLAFALNHAVKHGLRRVITVIPFTSVIEQTADVYRQALGTDEAVLEHHSAFDPDRASPGDTDDTEEKRTSDGTRDDEGPTGANKARLAAENWDVPVVVTTAVQFFESLFSNRPGRCRKLHNIAKSVIVLDEAQTLPLKLLRPCLEAVRDLAEHCGCTIVLCTATQPAVRLEDGLPNGLEGVRELAPDPTALYQDLKRVRVTRAPAPLSVEDLAGRLCDDDQVLCIVNKRAHARALYQQMQQREETAEGARMLTTAMCAAHRRVVLAEIKEDLKAGRPVRLAATSLVEAGVDFSFPQVYRAMTGLESIVQAAGRCNREGELESALGQVVVFEPAEAGHGPLRELITNAEEAQAIFDQSDIDPLGLDAIKEYFQELYWLRDGHGALDAALVDQTAGLKGILKVLAATNTNLVFPFEDIARAFRMIEDTQVPVIVRYPTGGDCRVDEWINGLEYDDKPGAVGRYARKLQPYTVPMPRRARLRLIETSAAVAIRPNDFGDQFVVLANPHLYDEKTGLDWSDPLYVKATSMQF